MSLLCLCRSVGGCACGCRVCFVGQGTQPSAFRFPCRFRIGRFVARCWSRFRLLWRCWYVGGFPASKPARFLGQAFIGLDLLIDAIRFNAIELFVAFGSMRKESEKPHRFFGRLLDWIGAPCGGLVVLILRILSILAAIATPREPRFLFGGVIVVRWGMFRTVRAILFDRWIGPIEFRFCQYGAFDESALGLQVALP